MGIPTLLQDGIFLLVVFLLVKPVGIYLKRVFAQEHTFLDPVLGPLERWIYRITRIDSEREMNARQYAVAFVIFSLVGVLALYALLRVQRFLLWFDAAHITTPMTPDLAINTAVSFATTTTWQAYAGETTMSYLSQLFGLAAQNFLAGAAGLAVGIAFIRGFARQGATTLGNFWVDLVRAMLWVLLPLSLIGSVVLIWQGSTDERSTVYPGENAGGKYPDHRTGAGRRARIYQKPGHRWRWLFQCQRCSPL